MLKNANIYNLGWKAGLARFIITLKKVTDRLMPTSLGLFPVLGQYENYAYFFRKGQCPKKLKQKNLSDILNSI
jgi:hypothetical protein